jgi:hypothetical protein
MYAKLVVGGSPITSVAAIRDIGRLLTAPEGNVSTSLLGAFSNSSSVILDSTPAGWTYVGSTNPLDRPTIGVVGTAYTQNTTAPNNICCSAPCLEGSALKYVALTVGYNTTGNTGYFAMTTASSANSTGVLVNETVRNFMTSTSVAVQNNFAVTGGQVYHLIANQQGVTIVCENTGLSAVWESSMTDVNRFYGTAPVVHYLHSNSTSVQFTDSSIGPSSTMAGGKAFAITVAVTDVNTGTYYGTYDVTSLGSANIFFLAQNDLTYRKNSIDATGAPKYQITPILYTNSSIGHPIQYVTGVVPIYWTKGSLGNSGDTVMVGADPYTYFNCGTGFGIIMKTS